MITINANDLKKATRFLTDDELQALLINTSHLGLYNYTYTPLTADQVDQLKSLDFIVEKTAACSEHEYKIIW